MTYLNKYQKWCENGQQGSILDNDDDSENSSNNQSEDDDGESNV